ncbi:phosphoglycerate dehydrogenase-like enzyme [Actinoplanes tereljensis]|uniref:Glycerate dehydrogenase n=1 Tax=Paractinoplanes tereljensis TaxID=571912 RepID=A0A919NYL4_9ACTN|nr:hydroxyacid dehydrogenase [Actinoplanes tereljensis]GIF26743.1 glycerate dehydrogenase [Actinoplanes tereljensis]
MTARNRPVAVLAMTADLPDLLFTPALRRRLAEDVELGPGPVLQEFDSAPARAALARAEVLITGWGSPRITAEVLDAAPALRAVVHTGGSVKGHVSRECWERGILVSSSAAANALPVAEYALAWILLAAKGARRLEHTYRTRRAAVDRNAEFPHVGAYRRSVGIIGASRIGRRVIELLRPFDLEVSLFDPYVTAAEAAALGVASATLPDLLTGSDIVSLHAPALHSTRHMIDAAGLARMPDGATLINTARGSLVDQEALVAELLTGRIDAVIDTTEPEVPPPDSPLYTLPNVVLTPHIAGAQGNELLRLGESAADEVHRYVTGLPLAHPVVVHDLARIA